MNATDVDIHYYLDGNWVGQHRGSNFVGKPMNIIINLQMEGASSSPGPTTDTYYRARNVYVGRTRARGLRPARGCASPLPRYGVRPG
ncbi:hypothetical protein EV652_10793 [Kribbella steppae]|uniref:Glycosyl hydrolase family 16 n=1 Tax=Kribbella steppae TaxID=2512223 RepID=A0A4R2HCU0_9ACTN|nr:hypothetical protein [Kribbella steppae]TCO26202.1 hypothetical protein EV652_10793 [Kribbella steppae]